jgi:beta-N-acetylhexosaminidase
MRSGRWVRYSVGLVLVLALVLGGSMAGAQPGGGGGAGPNDRAGKPHHAGAPMPKKPPRSERGQRAWIEAQIRQMTLEEKVGQMFVTYAYGERADDPDPAMVAENRKLYGVDNFEELIAKYKLGGVIYFAWSNNVNDPEQIAVLSNGVQRASIGQRMRLPLLVSTDQEQGVVVRVSEPATQFPGNMALGAGRNAQDAYTAASITGEELRAIGINQNFAPTADVNVNPQNPVIGVRSFGSDPGLVSELTAAQVDGYQDAEVSSTAKHFPGHGNTDVDSHYGLPVIPHDRQELAEIDLPPFEAAIESGIDAIMTAHILVPALDDSDRPATLSRPILTGLLREQLGFGGLIVTDALTMAGVREQFGDDRVPVEAIKAGADILLMPPDLDLAYNAVLDAVRSGEVPERRLDESIRRILRVKIERGAFERPYVDEDRVSDVVGAPEHLTVADEITARTITLVKNEAGLLPLAPNGGQEVLVTGAGGAPGSPADSVDRSTLGSLAAELERYGVSATVRETGTNPNAATRRATVEQARSSDLVVVTTNRAWSSGNQQQLVRDLLETGTPIVVAAVRDPYDIAYFTATETYLATYSYRPVSMQALARVMFGEVEPTGRLPVTIPEAGEPGSTLYPYGHGLGYGG